MIKWGEYYSILKSESSDDGLRLVARESEIEVTPCREIKGGKESAQKLSSIRI